MRKQLPLLFVVGFFCYASAFAQEKVDLEMVKKIRDEGLQRSKVMDHAFYLTDVSGPRLQGSPGWMRAAKWAQAKLTEWGLTDARLEAWGEFGKGWELEKSYIAMTAPYYKPFIAVPKAWCGGSDGFKQADILYFSESDTTAIENMKGALKGKIILIDRLTENIKQSFTGDSRRYTDEDLAKMAAGNSSRGEGQMSDSLRRNLIQTMRRRGTMSSKMREIAKREGALAILSMTATGKDGTVFVSGAGFGVQKTSAPAEMLDMMLSAEDYLMLCRLAKAGIPVKLEMDVKTKFYTDDTQGYNVLAEIKGTDSKLKEEIVMVGAHLDSWHSATGATDNAAGSAVMMEAVRILKALNIKPRRTIRIGLWSAEEEGLLGSAGYVKKHFKEEGAEKNLANFSTYFNLDNGTGKVRGVYLQENEDARPVFEKWLEPFKDLGATTITKSNTGGTDHLSFNGVGLPGFQFIQDPLEYNTRTHHTNMDTYDHLIPEDLKQAATVIAACVYQAAMRDEKMPRKAK
ncbi:M20/M25/M40 family metallo-hydrolase [Runella sp.]|uniref:M20/M25/M40 family metallo-hydrolase n=1 Tax=Runella sp. TaxID=1960881 RepID=UPI003D1288F5